MDIRNPFRKDNQEDNPVERFGKPEQLPRTAGLAVPGKPPGGLGATLGLSKKSRLTMEADDQPIPDAAPGIPQDPDEPEEIEPASDQEVNQVLEDLVHDHIKEAVETTFFREKIPRQPLPAESAVPPPLPEDPGDESEPQFSSGPATIGKKNQEYLNERAEQAFNRLSSHPNPRADNKFPDGGALQQEVSGVYAEVEKAAKKVQEMSKYVRPPLPTTGSPGLKYLGFEITSNLKTILESAVADRDSLRVEHERTLRHLEELTRQIEYRDIVLAGLENALNSMSPGLGELQKALERAAKMYGNR